MTITKNVNGTTTELIIQGWMDTQSAPQLGEEVNKLGDETELLVLNMKELEYTSSAGIRMIVAAYKKMKGALVLKHLSPEINEISLPNTVNFPDEGFIPA